MFPYMIVAFTLKQCLIVFLLCNIYHFIMYTIQYDTAYLYSTSLCLYSSCYLYYFLRAYDTQQVGLVVWGRGCLLFIYNISQFTGQLKSRVYLWFVSRTRFSKISCVLHVFICYIIYHLNISSAFILPFHLWGLLKIIFYCHEF